MSDLLSSLKNNRFILLYIVAGFIGFAILWFGRKSTDPAAVTAGTVPPTPAQSTATKEVFAPGKENVSPTTHAQLETLRKRLVEAPDDTTHLLRLARLLQDAHQPEEATRNYRHYLALRPGNRQAWLDLTQCLGELSDWEEALRTVDAMLDRYANDPSALYNKGAILANSARFGEAREVWLKASKQVEDPEVAVLARQSLNKLPSD